MDELLRLLTLQDATTRVVMAGTGTLAIAAAIVGTLAMLRRRALVGDAVAHASLPGICLAWFVAGDRGLATLLLGALVLGLACMGTIALVQRCTRAREDATIAIAIGGFFGIGIVLSRLIQNRPGGNRAGLDGFLFGKAASAVASDAWLVLAVSAVVASVVLALRKEFALLCFDREYAAGIGRPVHRLDALLLVLVALVTVAGLPSVGVVLMVAMLVIPPAAARFWSESFGTVLAIAAGIGAVSAVVGTGLSAVMPPPDGASGGGWPTGPIIVLTAAGAFLVSLLLAPDRGLVSAMLRHRRMRRRTALHHVLRDAYELLESRGDLADPFDAHELDASPRDVAIGLRVARSRGLIAGSAGRLGLTAAGRIEAARIVRTHRLWELWLIDEARIAVDHVDRDADDIEHLLPASLVARIDSSVRAGPGRVVTDGLVSVLVPPSPHPIERGATP